MDIKELEITTNQIEEIMTYYHLWFYFYYEEYKDELDALFKENI